MCDEWLGRGGFARFLADMGERPRGKTLDRIDTNGHYCPTNCRWATRAEQNANQREALLPGDDPWTRSRILAERADAEAVTRATAPT